MKSFKYTYNLFFQIIIVTIVLTCAFFIKRNYPNNEIVLKKQDTASNIKANSLRIMSLGNQRFFASLLYTFTFLEADLEHYKGDPLNNWMFFRFKTILELDERFTEAAHWGGMYLSIIKDDSAAAAIIFDLGLKHYPDHFWLNYWSGFNYYLELKDPKKALQYYQKILSAPEMYRFASIVPSILSDIANKISLSPETRDLLNAEILKTITNSQMPETIKNRVLKKLEGKK